MHRSLALALLLLCTAATAAAAPMPVNGTLKFDFGFDFPTCNCSVSLTGSGMGDSAGGVGSAASVQAGLDFGTATVSVAVTPPQLNFLSKITIAPPFANFAGSFAPGGAMGNNLVANLFLTSGAAAGSVPLNYVGGGGTAMALIAGLQMTIVGFSFTNLGLTPGNPTIMTSIGPTGSAAGLAATVEMTAFDKRTAGGLGTLQLVAPAQVLIFGGNLGWFPIASTLTLQFVPEPGLLLLIGTGAIALATLGRRQRA